MRWRLTNIALA